MIPRFLGLEEVIVLHRDQIDRYGGSTGIRDQARIIHDDSTQTSRSLCCKGRTAFLGPAAYGEYASVLRYGVRPSRGGLGRLQKSRRELSGLSLLESAVAAPQASFDGAFLHATAPEMAAAYLFHLAQNHAFVDGNKRVAAASMIMFLYLNALDLDCSEDELVELTMGVAKGETTKAAAAVFLAAHVCPVR